MFYIILYKIIIIIKAFHVMFCKKLNLNAFYFN